jgi:hypothetical protein
MPCILPKTPTRHQKSESESSVHRLITYLHLFLFKVLVDLTFQFITQYTGNSHDRIWRNRQKGVAAKKSSLAAIVSPAPCCPVEKNDDPTRRCQLFYQQGQ